MEGGIALMTPADDELSRDPTFVQLRADMAKGFSELNATIRETKLSLESGQRDLATKLDFQGRTDEAARAGLRSSIDVLDRRQEKYEIATDQRFVAAEDRGRANFRLAVSSLIGVLTLVVAIIAIVVTHR